MLLLWRTRPLGEGLPETLAVARGDNRFVRNLGRDDDDDDKVISEP